MNSRWRSIGVVTSLVLMCGAAALVTLRAVAQNAEAPAPKPSAAEESATITDDATIAPDANQSADKNISFPVDI